MSALFSRFSPPATHLLAAGQRLAEQLERPLTSELLLIILLEHARGVVGELISGAQIDRQRCVDFLLNVPAGDPENGVAGELAHVLEYALTLTLRYRGGQVDPEHIFLAMLECTDSRARKVLETSALNITASAQRLHEWLKSVRDMSEARERVHAELGRGAKSEETDQDPLEVYCTDLTALAVDRVLDPMVGRETELEHMIHVLLRRKKSNPLLVGEAGVGKTALVEGLAQRIAQQAVPAAFQGTRILQLDLAQMLAGTMYRGQFEERLKALTNALLDEPKSILFIDEMHMLKGAGSAEGAADAANILKPLLAKGSLRVIGATTHEEYRRHILADAALSRRFETIIVNEPSEKDAIRILKGQKRLLERHHHVLITDEAITAAVRLSGRFIPNRQLPDKALDLLDHAATYHAALEKPSSELAETEERLELVREAQQQLVEVFGTEGQSELLWEQYRTLEREAKQLEQTAKKQLKAHKSRVAKPVTDYHVAQVLSHTMHIPIDRIRGQLHEVDLSKVETDLTSHIVGQSDALKTITQALARHHFGLNDERKPIGAFLLVGPTGVGKTETAKRIAHSYFGTSEALVTVDMSQFAERHATSSLVGAPPGYVGYDDGGSLTESVRKRPYAVVLFDEVEKAHPDAFNIFLRLLDEGELTDSQGRTVSFRNTLILMTSNIGMHTFTKHARIGFGSGTDAKNNTLVVQHVQKELEQFFRPEFLARLTAVIHFKPLTSATVTSLVTKQLNQLKTRLGKRDIQLTWDKQGVAHLVSQYDSSKGARSIEALVHSLSFKVLEFCIAHASANRIKIELLDGDFLVSSSTPLAE